MKTTLLRSLGVIVALQLARSQESTTTPKPPERHETTVTLDFGAQGKKTMIFPASPYVTPKGWITILVGESYTVEFDIVDGQPKNLRYVSDKSEKAKPGTGRLTVSLSQDKDITLLMRETDAEKPLAMRCLTQSYGEDQLRQNNLNPATKIPSADSWTNTVASVMLGEIRFTEEPKKDAKNAN